MSRRRGAKVGRDLRCIIIAGTVDAERMHGWCRDRALDCGETIDVILLSEAPLLLAGDKLTSWLLSNAVVREWQIESLFMHADVGIILTVLLTRYTKTSRTCKDTIFVRSSCISSQGK